MAISHRGFRGFPAPLRPSSPLVERPPFFLGIGQERTFQFWRECSSRIIGRLQPCRRRVAPWQKGGLQKHGQCPDEGDLPYAPSQPVALNF